VAGRTGTDDVAVIDAGDRDPAAGAVAVLTDTVGLDVCGVLAGGIGAIVASRAVAGNVGVVKDRTVPTGGVMAVFTDIAITQVAGVLASGRGTVVAGEAGADDVGVSNPDDWNPAAGAVAVFTQGIGLYMVAVLAGGGAAVVAADTITGHVSVIKSCAAPARRSVAVAAVVAAGHVIMRFSNSGLTVMAETAGAGNIAVFKTGYLLPV